MRIKAKYVLVEPYCMKGTNPDGPVMYSGSINKSDGKRNFAVSLKIDHHDRCHRWYN
jgi:hypothetical protein